MMRIIDYLIPDRAATIQQLGHPQAGVIGWEHAGLNTSGEAVTPNLALNYSAVWCAKRVISETVASLPCILYRRTANGGKERAREDSRYSLVHDSPNNEQGASTFFETGTFHLVDGNSYSRITRMGNEPISLDLIQPDTLHASRRDGDGVIEYKIIDPPEMIEWPDMLHVIGLSADGLMGESVVSRARQTIGTGIAQEKYAGGFFGNSAMPRGAIVHPQKLAKEARESFRRDWDELHQGAGNSNKIAILHGGMDYKQLGMNHEDAQFLESRQFSVQEIARWYRLPPHFLGDLTHATFSNIEHQSLDFVKFSMLPWLKRWETALAQKLLRRQERGDLFFEFLVEGLLRADTMTRNQSNAVARQWGWKSVNEIRAEENMNPVENGDVYLQPLNMTPAGEPPPEPNALAAELMANLEAKWHEIASIAAGVATMQHSIAEADQRLQLQLKSHRDDTEAIKRDFAEQGTRIQVMGATIKDLQLGAKACEAVRQSANDLLQHVFAAMIQRETSQVVKLARSAVSRGTNFWSEVEAFYRGHRTKCLEVFLPIVTAWAITADDDANAVVEKIIASHFETSKRDLLEASEVPINDLVVNVERVVATWQSRTVSLS